MTLDTDCCRMEKYQYALYRKFREPRLYHLAAKGDWGPIPQRCKAHPKEAAFIHKYAPSDTALHQILRFPALSLTDSSVEFQTFEMVKESAITSLINTHPPIASVKDSFGRMPLHLACMEFDNCGEQSFYKILQAYPQAAAHQDFEARTPLHYLVARANVIPEGVLSKLLAACPGALEMKDLVKETPVDLVKSRENEDADSILKQLSLCQEMSSTPSTETSVSTAVES